MADKVDELREATRAANEALADLKTTMRDMRTLMAQMEVIKSDLTEVAVEVFDERMGEQVKAGLDAYKETIDRQIEHATAAVYNRFEQVSDILLGRDGSGMDFSRINVIQFGGNGETFQVTKHDIPLERP